MSNPFYPGQDSWALVGFRNGSEAQLYQGYVRDVSFHIPRVPVHSLGRAATTYIPAGPPEVEAKIHASRSVTASTFAECMKILANTWQPDINPARGSSAWRPVPR